MKIIKEWEWECRKLAVGHQWGLDESDISDKRMACKFDLFSLFIAIGWVEIVIFNFGIVYQKWGVPKPQTIGERNAEWKINEAKKKAKKYKAWVDEGVEK